MSLVPNRNSDYDVMETAVYAIQKSNREQPS